jgi:methylated-DNA-[protein]-cysteine S-methyltransferase
MRAEGFTLFDTPIGCCGIAWSSGRIAGVQLPEADAASTRRRLRRRFPAAEPLDPPPLVAGAIAGMRSLLQGEPASLAALPLALEGLPDLDRRVYALAQAIPRGAVRTYGEIAAQLGAPEAAREVGAALARNPFPLIVPCHRVVAAGGRLGGFSAAGGAIAKRRLLAIEQARFGAGPDLFDPGEAAR